MQGTLTFKLQSFYAAYAPEAGVWSYGDCSEDAINNLADQLRAIARAGDTAGRGPLRPARDRSRHAQRFPATCNSIIGGPIRRRQLDAIHASVIVQAVILSINNYTMRSTKTVSISMTPAELREAENLAKATNRSLSGFVREGLQRMKVEQRWSELNAYGRKGAKRLGITEKDVVRLTKEVRKEFGKQRTNKQPVR